MFNHSLGVAHEADGQSFIVTRYGSKGHALFGPYEELEPGNYVVEFTLTKVGDRAMRPGAICAVLDVACDGGKRILNRLKVSAGELRDTPTRHSVAFKASRRVVAEYRAYTSGAIELRIDSYRPVVRLADGEDPATDRIASRYFPEIPDEEAPVFFVHRKAQLRELHDSGVFISIENGSVVMEARGVRAHARCDDDILFIQEVFFEGAYNILTARPSCLIDIGMNCGFVSLLLAQTPNVIEVHSFEPFPDTFRRAADNLALNPELAKKITAYQTGLSDRNRSGDVRVSMGIDSGSRSLHASDGGGVKVQLDIRDAGEALGPVFVRAREQNLDVILKIDCEGSEFEIFPSLDRASLLDQAAGFMVEYHPGPLHPGGDLTDYLLRRGFLIFDRGVHAGNGFFYAVKVGAAGAGAPRSRGLLDRLFGG